MDMLSEQDLHAIGTIVDEKIKANNEVLAESITDTILSVVKEGFDGVDKRFEAVDKRFDTMTNEMATKSDLNALRTELMDHTDRTVEKAVGNLRSELREHNVIA